MAEEEEQQQVEEQQEQHQSGKKKGKVRNRAVAAADVFSLEATAMAWLLSPATDKGPAHQHVYQRKVYLYNRSFGLASCYGASLC